MAIPTLWDNICRLTQEDRDAGFTIDQAVDGSAVTKPIAETEFKRFIAEGYVEGAGANLFRLTEEGKKQCTDMHQSQRYTGL